MNVLQVIWVLTTAIHVIWIQAVQLQSGAKPGDVNPSQGGPAFWPQGGVTHPDYQGIAHCWLWIAGRSQFLPKPFLRFWRQVSLLGNLGVLEGTGHGRSGTLLAWPRLHKAHLLSAGNMSPVKIFFPILRNEDVAPQFYCHTFQNICLHIKDIQKMAAVAGGTSQIGDRGCCNSGQRMAAQHWTVHHTSMRAENGQLSAHQGASHPPPPFSNVSSFDQP